jgi:hypothetical protein
VAGTQGPLSHNCCGRGRRTDLRVTPRHTGIFSARPSVSVCRSWGETSTAPRPPQDAVCRQPEDPASASRRVPWCGQEKGWFEILASICTFPGHKRLPASDGPVEVCSTLPGMPCTAADLESSVRAALHDIAGPDADAASALRSTSTPSASPTLPRPTRATTSAS